MMQKVTRGESIRLEAIRQRNGLATLLTIGSVAYLVACQIVSPSLRPLSASLRTDSAQIGVHRSGFGYIADIGFVYTNTTAQPVSKAGCGGPTFPDLEKKVDGHWVRAYSPLYAACMTKPDFMLRSGESYHGVLKFMAFDPGHNTMPTLDVDTIDGIYRLRWDFVEGAGWSVRDFVERTDAYTKGARKVEGISNEFRMNLSENNPAQ
jgi:hypothetical protein